MTENPQDTHLAELKNDFRYTIDRFADLKVMRYRVPGWESLDLRQKERLYYLSEAANAGRDILYAQNFKYNILIKRVLEAVYETYSGIRDSDAFRSFEIYLKRFWFSNGIHHHYACEKFLPDFSREYWKNLLENSDLAPVFAQMTQCRESQKSGSPRTDSFPEILTVEQLAAFLEPILFDPEVYGKRINLDPEKGLAESSACNYYDGPTTREAESFYATLRAAYESVHPEAADCPLSYGLNSRLVKRGGELFEQICRIGGLYSEALERVVFWLEKACQVAESELQKRHMEILISYYRSGDLKLWDDYNICWVQDTDSFTDYTNGFIETYGDPLGIKASWEAIADFRNEEASERTRKISEHAPWFEEHSPIDPRFKKSEVKGISAKVITMVQLGGDCFPSSPIGINLPNADWIRRDYGSKSVTIENLTVAFDKSAEENGGMLQEFAFDDAEIERCRTYGILGGNLHTDLHECLGHGSGQLLAGVSSDALKSYASTLEEARADLFALYYLPDPKLRELGLVSDIQVAMAEYDSYIRNGLMTQLVRIAIGKDLEEAHMRNRSMVAHWVYERGESERIVEKIRRNGKTYFKINDYDKLRALFAEMLAEVQRIKSEGDYQAGRDLVERYGVKVDPELHREVLDRYAKLGLAPYGGFVNPDLCPVLDSDGNFQDVRIAYPDDFAGQMMSYAKKYSTLPIFI